MAGANYMGGKRNYARARAKDTAGKAQRNYFGKQRLGILKKVLNKSHNRDQHSSVTRTSRDAVAEISLAHAKRGSSFSGNHSYSNDNRPAYLRSPTTPNMQRTAIANMRLWTPSSSSTCISTGTGKTSRILSALDTSEPILMRREMERLRKIPDLAGLAPRLKPREESRDTIAKNDNQLSNRHGPQIGSAHDRVSKKRKLSPSPGLYSYSSSLGLSSVLSSSRRGDRGRTPTRENSSDWSIVSHSDTPLRWTVQDGVRSQQSRHSTPMPLLCNRSISRQPQYISQIDFESMARSDPDFEPMPLDSSPIGSGKHEVSHGNTMFEDKEEDNANGILQYSGDAALSGLLAGYAPTRYSFYDQLSRQNLPATGSSDFAEIPQEPFSGMRETFPEQTFMEYFTPITGSRCPSPVVVCPASMSLRSNSWDLSSPSRLTLLQPPERIFEMQDQGDERLDDGQPEVANPVRNTEEATLAPRSLCQEQEDLSLPSPTVSAISTRSALQDSGYVTTTTGQHMAESVNACFSSPFSIKLTQEALRLDASSLPPAISLNATCSASISERLLDALDGQLFETADPWRALDKLLGLRVPSETTPETPNRGCRATSPTSAPENTDCGFLASLYDQSKRGVGYNMMNGLNADDRMPGSAPELTRSYISMNVVRHVSTEQYGSRAVDEFSTQSILAADLSQSISSETLAAPLSPEQSTSEDLSQRYEDQLPVEMHADCGSRLREDDMIKSPLQASLSHSTQQNQNPSDDRIRFLVQDTRNPGISIASSSGTDNVSVEAERDKANEDDKRKNDESLPAMRNNISVTEQEFDGPCLFSNECDSEDDG